MPSTQKNGYKKLSKANLRPESEFKNDEEYQKKAKTKNFLSNLLFDSGVGIAAGFNITALYAGVRAAMTFISGLVAQIIFPVFILIDLLDLRNVWANFIKSKKLNGGKWKGSRNTFARAVLTSVLVPLSIFVVVGSFIPGFLPGIAISLSFTAIMAARSAFNIGSGFFNLGRSKIANNPEKGLHGLQSRIQLGVGASNMLSLAATVSVFLLGGLGLATFGFAPIGIAAGIVLAGVLAYAFYKTYQDRKKVKNEMIEMRKIPGGAESDEPGADLNNSQRLRMGGGGSRRTASTRIEEAGPDEPSMTEENPLKKRALGDPTINSDEGAKKDGSDDFNPRAGEPPLNQQSGEHDLMPTSDANPNASEAHNFTPSNDNFVEPDFPLSGLQGSTFAKAPVVGSTSPEAEVEAPRPPTSTNG